MSEEKDFSRGNAENSASGTDRQKAAEEFAKTAAGHREATSMPRLDFSTFVMSLSSSAMMHLGEIPEPETGSKTENMSMARQTIDLLGMLEEKTNGNLTQDESRLLKDVLFELRMKYVQKSR
ncbi:MAG: DUF1844 domain-containing protein [Desulfonatronovibrionaceae bacterium]